jgi:hypothetical protein
MARLYGSINKDCLDSKDHPLNFSVEVSKMSDGSTAFALWLGDYKVDCIGEHEAICAYQTIFSALRIATGEVAC